MNYAFRISPSAIEKYRDCPYSWYLKYILKKQESRSDTSSTDLGSQLHTVAEHMLEDKTVPEELRHLIPFVAPGLPFLTVRPEDVAIEDNIEHTLEGVNVIGRIDFWSYSPNGILTVGDWKSCKSFSYMKKPAELAAGVQPCMYAWLLVITGKCPPPKKIHFQHIYLNTVKPQAKSTLVTDVTWADVLKVMKGVTETLEHMKTTSLEMDHEVERYTSSCWKFGGCRLAASCDKSPYKLKTKFPLAKEPEEPDNTMFRPPALPPAAKIPGANPDTIQEVMTAAAPPPKPPAPAQSQPSPPSGGSKFIFLGTGPLFPRADVQVLSPSNADSGMHFTLPPAPFKDMEATVLNLQHTKGYVLVMAKEA